MRLAPPEIVDFSILKETLIFGGSCLAPEEHEAQTDKKPIISKTMETRNRSVETMEIVIILNLMLLLLFKKEEVSTETLQSLLGPGTRSRL